MRKNERLEKMNFCENNLWKFELKLRFKNLEDI